MIRNCYYKIKNFSFFLLVACISCDTSEPNKDLTPEIVAKIQIFSLNEVGEGEYEQTDTVIGEASFFQIGEVVRLEISLFDMTPNTSKAVHIHEGSVEQPGRHWNAEKFVAACNLRSLGSVWGKPFIGDVGNVVIDAQGNGIFSLETNLWTLDSGEADDLLDRPIIVHDREQDFIRECDPAHNHGHLHANPKIGGGQITLLSAIE